MNSFSVTWNYSSCHGAFLICLFSAVIYLRVLIATGSSLYYDFPKEPNFNIPIRVIDGFVRESIEFLSTKHSTFNGVSLSQYFFVASMINCIH